MTAKRKAAYIKNPAAAALNEETRTREACSVISIFLSPKAVLDSDFSDALLKRACLWKDGVAYMCRLACVSMHIPRSPWGDSPVSFLFCLSMLVSLFSAISFGGRDGVQSVSQGLLEVLYEP